MKALIFDVFGTLIKVEKCNSAKSIMANIAKATGAVMNEEGFLSEWRSFYASHANSGDSFISERDIFIARIEMFYVRYGVHRNAEADYESMFASAYKRDAYEDVLPALNRLRTKYRIILGSNTDNDVLDAVLSKNGIITDGVYTSESLKCYKPDIEFFNAILEAEHLKPHEVLFIGDNPRDDIKGPKQAGIKTVFIDRNSDGGDYGQTCTIHDLSELVRLLGV